jgi:hypothetical protein
MFSPMQSTMIPDKLQEIMKQDGVVAIATLGTDGPHLVNTWNSYLYADLVMEPMRGFTIWPHGSEHAKLAGV